jgi:tripartite-type tricarboxylate transporter receptor subunit TctC
MAFTIIEATMNVQPPASHAKGKQACFITGERRGHDNQGYSERRDLPGDKMKSLWACGRMRMRMKCVRVGWMPALMISFLAGLVGSSPGLAADSVEAFYKGKTMQLLIGFGPGGGYDLYGRAVARHMGRFIPGNPSLVPQNMAGAGSVRAASSLYNAAPKDGSVIGTFSRGIIVDTLLGANKGMFDAQNFGWIGSVTNEVSVCGFSRRSGIQTWDDMLSKDTTVGSSGTADDLGVYANVLRSVFDAKLKLVSGYPGTADILLAVERGELGGLCGWSWSTLKSRSKALYESKEIAVPVQLGLSPHEDLAGVPLITTLTKDPTKSAVLRLIFSRQTMARPFAAPPGLPEERLRALRTAFDATMKDKDFLAEAQRLDLEVRPVSGLEIDALVANLAKTPVDIRKLAAEASANAP